MGLYNPYAPQILGQEWAPIRDEVLTFDPESLSVESGHSFVLTSSQRVRDARIYVNDFSTPPTNGVNTVQIYPLGAEALSGPIQRIIIPVPEPYRLRPGPAPRSCSPPQATTTTCSAVTSLPRNVS